MESCKGLRILPECYPLPVELPGIQPPPGGNIMEEFHSVFDGTVKVMEGEFFHITLADDAQPFCVHTPRTIPYAFRDKLRLELDSLQAQGIIYPVTEPTAWCAPIVVTPKKNSDQFRLCVDLPTKQIRTTGAVSV